MFHEAKEFMRTKKRIKCTKCGENNYQAIYRCKCKGEKNVCANCFLDMEECLVCGESI